MNCHPCRRAFTLVELVVVIALIAVLAGLLLPAVQGVRSAVLRVHCANHLKQIGLALHQYHDSQGSLPPGCSYRNGADPHPHMSWCTRLLPFLEQEALWQQALRAFALERFFERVPPHTGLGTVVPIFTCRTDGRVLSPWDFGPFQAAFTSYLGVEGINQYSKDGLLFLDSRVRLTDVTDGTSNTLMVGERPPSADRSLGWWYAGWGQSKDGSAEMVLGVKEINVHRRFSQCPRGPYEFGPGDVDNPCDVFHFWSPHTGGANFVFADGSVRFLRYSVTALMPALATRNGGEPVSPPD
jgi:prepilin-type N-terminal cleavage/methylation domain-containing protein/prepilin-type processing-associated H-X9-DG protein